MTTTDTEAPVTTESLSAEPVPAASTPAPGAEGDSGGDEGYSPEPAKAESTDKPKKEEKPKTLREKIEARAQASEAKRAKEARTGAEPPAPAAPTTPKVPASPGKTQTAPASVEPPKPAGAYAANFKFKVMDKEHEIPEWLRPVITDAETEKKVKELHEKALGLDVVKARFQQERQQTQSLNERVGVYESTVGDLRKAYSRGDFGAVFQRLHMDEGLVLQYFIDRAKLLEASPEERQVLERGQQAQRQAWEAQDRVEALQGSVEQTSAYAKQESARVLLAKPDVQAYVNAFETAPGRKQGDFWNAMCDEGEFVYLQSQGKTDLTPDQVFERVKQRYGTFAAPAPAPAPQAQGAGASLGAPAPAAQPAPQEQALRAVKPEPKVIPNVGGRAAASPTPSKPRSIADLKKLAAQFR